MCLLLCILMARFSRHEQPWGQWVDVKVNAADSLAKNLRSLKTGDRRSAEVIISTVTDPYQPLEQEYGITRACLETLATATSPLRVSLLTKSDLVTRDIDVLRDLEDVEVGMTLTTTDDDVSRRYEPGASPASRRLAALTRLSHAGLRTWAFVAPVLPYHSDSYEATKLLLAKILEAGVTRIMVDRFNPYPSSVSRFLRAAPSDAARTMRTYIAQPLEYLTWLRRNIQEAAESLGAEIEILF